jgi:hypothetical protein
MANRSGLVELVKNVRTYFTDHRVTAHVSLGWRERTKSINQGPGCANRVVFTPSDPSGRGGRITKSFGNRGPGANPRPLVTWERFVVVSIWGADGTKPHDEEAQIEAVETLFEWTIRAVQAFAAADATWGDPTWTTSPIEHAFGRELLVPLTHRETFFDVENPVVTPTPIVNRQQL